MVIRGGENLFPREIEEALIHHPNVEGKFFLIIKVIFFKKEFKFTAKIVLQIVQKLIIIDNTFRN